MDNNIFINKSISDLSFDNIVNNNSDIKLIDNIIDSNRIFLEDTEYSEIYGLLKYQEDITHSFSLLYKQNIKRDYLLDAIAASFIQTKINDLDKKDLILEDTDSSKIYSLLKYEMYLTHDFSLLYKSNIKEYDIDAVARTSISHCLNNIDDNDIDLENIDTSKIYGLLNHEVNLTHDFSLIYKNLPQNYEWLSETTKFIERKNSNIYKNIFTNIVYDINFIDILKGNIVNTENKKMQENHGFNVGDAIYFDTNDNMYKKSIADNSEKSQVYGVVTEVPGENVFAVLQYGIIDYKNINFNDTSILYLSDINPGKLVHYSEIQNKVYIPVGFYIGNKLLINPQQGSSGINLIPYEDNTDQNFDLYTQTEIDDIIDFIIKGVS